MTPKMETFDRLTAGVLPPGSRAGIFGQTGEPLTTDDLREIGRRMASTPEPGEWREVTPLHDESTLDAMAREAVSSAGQIGVSNQGNIDVMRNLTRENAQDIKNRLESARMNRTPPSFGDELRDAMDRQGAARTYGTDTNAGSFDPTPRDKSEIDVALDTLSGELSKYQSLNFQLIKRLEPIMQPEYDGSGPVIRHETTIPLAQTINDRVFDLQIENWRLQSILERLAI